MVLRLSEEGIIIKGLTDGVDTSTINGRLFLNIMASLAEYERELIRERTKAGLESARARGGRQAERFYQRHDFQIVGYALSVSFDD